MTSPTRRVLPIALLALAGLVAALRADDADRLKVGVQPDGRIVVPTNQILQPAGAQVVFPGRPVDLAVIEDGRALAVKNMRDLVFLDLATGQVRQTLPTPAAGRKRPGFSVVGLTAVGDRIYASDAEHSVRVTRRRADGRYVWDEPLRLPAPAVGDEPYPAGLAALGGDRLAVASSRGNCVHVFDLAARRVE